MAQRVLLLHSLEGKPDSGRHNTLQQILGKKGVRAPDLGTRSTIMTVTIIAIFLLAAVSIGLVLDDNYELFTSLYIESCLFGPQILISILAYYFGGRLVTSYVLKNAVIIAEKHFKEYRPNVIVASSFGAVVLFNMDIPKLPLLLFSPAQDSFCRYMKKKELKSIRSYPYSIIVHGSLDETVPLEDSIRLVETAEVGHCRLEVIEDHHKMPSLKEDDVKALLDEVFERGRENVFALSKEGKKYVDTSLFDEEEGSLNDLPSDPLLTRGELKRSLIERQKQTAAEQIHSETDTDDLSAETSSDIDSGRRT